MYRSIIMLKVFGMLAAFLSASQSKSAGESVSTGMTCLTRSARRHFAQERSLPQFAKS